MLNNTTTQSADAQPRGQGVALTAAQRGLIRERMYLDGREAHILKRLSDKMLPERERWLLLRHHAAVTHHREALQERIAESPLLAQLDAAAKGVPVENN